MSTVDINTADMDQLKNAAEKLGLDIDGRWGIEKVRQVVSEELQVRQAGKEAAEQAAAIEAAALASEQANTASMPNLSAALAEDQAAALEKSAVPANETAGARRARLRREATKLIRIQVSCMDPSKKDLKGELFCISNRNFGNIQRFVPFNREWHVEQVMLDMILEKTYMVFDSEKTPRAGIDIKTPRNVPAYNVRILPPLTEKELQELAIRQSAADGQVK